jgi:ribosome-binding protein aMBF1 (putative translation factor)
MPSIHVVFYQEQEGDAPVGEWLKELQQTNAKAFLKCRAANAQSLTKEAAVPATDIKRAIARAKLPSPPTQPPTPLEEKFTMPKKTTTDALKILAHMTGKGPEMQRVFEEEVANREVVHRVFQLRQESGLPQVELARRVGTTQSVISRLEVANYEGHSLAMLNRNAAAMERRVEIRFVPRKRRLQTV